MVFIVRITDEYFNHEYVEINNKKYYFNKKKICKDNLEISEIPDEEEIFNKIGLEEFKSNKIIIKCKTEGDFKYAQTVLIYSIKNDKDEEHNLNKELER